MKSKMRLSRKDVLVFLLCAVFAAAGLGAVGAAGRRRAKEMVCKANLHGWFNAVWSFAEDNGGVLFERLDAIGWPEPLWPYYRNKRLLLCPEARKTYLEGGVNPRMAWGEYPFTIDGQTVALKGSYVINLWVAEASLEDDGYWGTPYVRSAARVPVILDAQHTTMQPYPEDKPQPYENAVWTPGPMDEMRRACLNRHDGVNAVFLDGSARKVGLKHLWVQWWYRGWEEDLAATGFPAWPEWMADFTEP
jgi:hypothetical protein